ncbi:5-oxoprolinase subunit PxpB [Paenibacillus sp.]|uniref:5-oxoprolinase subunit PxpB n=1 Tax=Paenibacillus sp. TaxID=58172 RepID=UPI002D269C44|nr:5-oxoprolinase subunit PxpB [Paenibacillus sp.]HZG85084.1 5-oxoprolinase subunit PxpB [Paenibacillus sp.]
MPVPTQPRFAPYGEQAVVLTFGDAFEPEAHRGVVQAANGLALRPFPGYREAVPTYTTICVFYDVIEVLEALAASGMRNAGAAAAYDAVCGWIRERIVESGEASGVGKTVRIPVCYCAVCGPDLPAVAEAAGLAPQEAAALHSKARYTVAMIGFLPGFPYLTGLPSALSVPRLDTPRALVPRGSVAIAGGQSGIYPADSPGGWRLIGRTLLPLFRTDRDPPSLLEIGDAVRFEPVDHAEAEGAATR